MEVFSAILAILVAAAAGFYFGRNLSSDTQEKTRLASELKQKTEELAAFQNKVTNHFEKTANLFNQVSDSYQSLYDHMAHSSSQLCATKTFQSLPKASTHADSPKLKSAADGLHKTNNQADNLFDADKLYKAHEYRNHEVEQEPPLPNPLESAIGFPPADNKVVDIDTAKEDKSQPPLDYAIKDKGVVNHNSLNVEGVKIS